MDLQDEGSPALEFENSAGNFCTPTCANLVNYPDLAGLAGPVPQPEVATRP